MYCNISLFFCIAGMSLLLATNQVLCQDTTIAPADGGEVVTSSAKQDTQNAGGNTAQDPAPTQSATGEGGQDVGATQEATGGGEAATEAAKTSGAADAKTEAPSTDGETVPVVEIGVTTGVKKDTEVPSGTTEAHKVSAADAQSTQVSDSETPAGGSTAATTAAAPVEEKATTAAEAIVVTQGRTTTPKPTTTTTPWNPDATYTVTTIPVAPYLEINKVDGGFQGYIVDVLEKMKRILNVDFKINLVSDGEYGRNKDGTWTGMIGEIVRGEAELAAAPLTVTSDRDEVVDFTQPIMSISASAVIMKRNPYRRPRINNFQDMIDNKFVFAVLNNSNIHRSLKASRDDSHKKMLQSIADNDGYMGNNDKGIARAMWDSKYAFLMESSAADYAVSDDPCRLEAFSTDVYKRKYAFAVPNQSPLRDKFNRALTDLQMDNTLEDLEAKWFRGAVCSGSFISCSVFNIGMVLALALYLLN